MERPFRDLSGFDLREIGYNAYDLGDLMTLILCLEEMTVHRPMRSFKVYRDELKVLKTTLEVLNGLDQDRPQPNKEKMFEIVNCAYGILDFIEKGEYHIVMACLWDGDDHSIYIGSTRGSVRNHYEALRSSSRSGPQWIGLMEPMTDLFGGLTIDSCEEIMGLLGLEIEDRAFMVQRM